MSNWQQQQQSFNLEAPEFVPKFGNGPPSNNQPSNNQAPPGMNFYQNNPQQQQQQQQHFNQGQPRAYNNNQQQQFNPQHRPYYQNNYYQQQQQQQQPPFQQYQQFQQQPPQQQQQQQPNTSPAKPAPSPAASAAVNNNQQQSNTDKQVNQITNNISKLSTSDSSPKQTTTAPAAASAAVESKQAEVSKPPAEAPVVEKKPDLEPSVFVEKSAPPQVAPIKEDNEEWEGDEAMDEAADEVTDEVAAGEAPKAKKKQLVIREYKAKKEPVNVIFCGHVDAGKSTIGGQIMFLTGMVDKRTLEKYEREAKEKNRESWYLSWALDTNLEEREKGKTVEVGRAFFETEKKHFIILDAPGHRGFVPNMIGGASQADIAVLVISARRGEFETGFEKGGQTREHAMLVKTAGVKYLIILVNKMDDPTVNWDEKRYEEIKEKLTPYIKKCGFQIGKDTMFMPCSGFTGAFIKDPVDESVCPWYRGPCFIDYIDTLPTINRTSNGPFRMPIIDKYKEMGTVVMGKIESGMVKLGEKLCLMPNKTRVEVTNIYCEEDETDSAICGENVKLKLKGVEEEEISGGFVLCDLKEVCQVAKVFDAQVIILECPSIICPGFNSIMHIHASTVEVQLKHIIGMVDKKTGEKDLKNRPKFIKQDQIAICRFDILNGAAVCMEPFKLFQQLGRFTLRYENKTVAVGKVLKVIE